jgi:hypothetical protein
VGARHVALSSHNEFQLSGYTELCGQTALLKFCREFAIRIAVWEMSEEFSEEFQKASVEMGTHEIKRYVF